MKRVSIYDVKKQDSDGPPYYIATFSNPTGNDLCNRCVKNNNNDPDERICPRMPYHSYSFFNSYVDGVFLMDGCSIDLSEYVISELDEMLDIYEVPLAILRKKGNGVSVRELIDIYNKENSSKTEDAEPVDKYISTGKRAFDSSKYLTKK